MLHGEAGYTDPTEKVISSPLQVASAHHAELE